MTTTATRERPILFSGPMVRAILDGRKTMTRRVMSPQPPAGFESGDEWAPGYYGLLQPLQNGEPMEPGPRDRWGVSDADGEWGIWCPYGAPGDRLWVRESWYYDIPPHELPKARPDDFDDLSLYFRADGECCEQIPECQCSDVGKPQWKPSIHLPRWASRITLVVESVRVERVQEISEADILAEGVGGLQLSDARERRIERRRCVQQYRGRPDLVNDSEFARRERFRELWDSINAKRGFGWDANPWVWVIGFRREEAAQPGSGGGA